MSNTHGNDDLEAAIDERRQRSGRPSIGLGRGLMLMVLIAIMGVALFAMLAPQHFRAVVALLTSEVEEMQRTSTAPPEITTNITIPRDQTPIVIEPDVMVPEAEPPAPEPQDDPRIDQLEARLAELQAAAENSMSSAELERLMEQQADSLRAETDRRLAEQQLAHAQELIRLRAGFANQGPSAADLAAIDAAQRAEEERRRLEAIRQDQIQSEALLFDESEPVHAVAVGGQNAVERDLNRNERFLASAAQADVETAMATQLANPGRTIVQGTILRAVLETTINTHLPGMLRATLTEDVRSYDGTGVLLPAGSRLIGTYSSDVSIAQNRVLIAWNRAVTPNGTSISLGSVGADRLGQSGQEGAVDSHFIERFGSAALISLIAGAPDIIIGERTSTTQLLGDVGGDLEQATQRTVDEYLRIPPTVHVDQGAEMIVFVNRDLVFPG